MSIQNYTFKSLTFIIIIITILNNMLWFMSGFNIHFFTKLIIDHTLRSFFCDYCFYLRMIKIFFAFENPYLYFLIKRSIICNKEKEKELYYDQ